MAEASVLRLKVDSQEYDAKIKRASEGLRAMEQACRKVGGTFEVVEREELAFVQSLGKMETVSKSTKGQLRELTQALTDMTGMYRSMSDAEKNSEFGKALNQSIQQLTERAGAAKDAMMDVQASITNAASDTRMFDQALGAMQFGTSVFQTLQAGASMFGIEMGNDVEIIKKLQSAMAMTQGLQSIQNLIQKQSALRQGTEKLFTLIKAHPYAAAATAVTALAVAVYKLSQKTDEATRVQKTLNDVEKEATKNSTEEITKLEILNERLHNSALSYDERKTALDTLQSVVPDYHASLTKEGELLDDNTEAIHDYANSLFQAAQARAAFNKVVELQGKKIEAEEKLRKAKKEQSAAKANQQYVNQNYTGGSSITGASTYTASASQDVVVSGIAVSNAKAEVDALNAEIGALKNLVTTDSLNFGKGGKGGKGGTGGGSGTGGGDKVVNLSFEDPQWEYAVKEKADKAGKAFVEAIKKEYEFNFGKDEWKPDFSGMNDDTMQTGVRFGSDRDTFDLSKHKAVPNDKFSLTDNKYFKGAEGISSGLSQINSSLETLGIDLGDGFDKALGVFQGVMGVVQGVQTIISAIQLFQTSNDAVQTGLLATIATNTAITATSSTVDAIIPFARGGIVHAAGGYRVPGNYMSGDLVPAMVNSGELILNKAQQGNLASQLQGGGLGNINLSATIKGEDIRLALNNNSRRRGKGEYVTTKFG